MKRYAWVYLLIATSAFAGIDRDIFNNDHETRRPAVNDEFNMALYLGGCSGFLIAPNIGASAAHCRGVNGQMKSGIALKEGTGSDFTIGRTMEIGSVGTYDYWIFEVRWRSGQMPHGAEFVPKVQVREDDLKVGDNAVADKIYTLGFPVDISNGRLIYAWGYGKRFSSRSLVNNIGLINGNSGGAIMRQMDDMLVSVVSGGPHAWGQPGWNNNDWNNSAHWNWGPAMWRVYGESQVLQELYPDGRNKYLDAEWMFDDINPAKQLLASISKGFEF